MNEISLVDVFGRVGQEVGRSEWIMIDQSTVDLFADATHDHQFIHVNPERAAVESPFGGTIAHVRIKRIEHSAEIDCDFLSHTISKWYARSDRKCIRSLSSYSGERGENLSTTG